MIPERCSIVIECDGGALPLVRTVDSARLQTHPAESILLAVSTRSPGPSLAAAVSERTGATVVRGDGLTAAVHSAVARAEDACVLIVPAGYVLDRGAVAALAATLDTYGDACCAVGTVTAQSPDGSHSAPWTPGEAFSELVADPTSAPPIVAVRSTDWPNVRPIEPDFEFAAGYDLRLQLASALPLCRTTRVVASVGVKQAYWQAFIDHPGYRAALQPILDRHRAAMEAQAGAIVIGREKAAAAIRREHRYLAGRRPGDAAELDRLRGALADARAWLHAYGFGEIDWGDLRRADPISRDWGYERGTPVDRRYIDDFLMAHASDVRGVVLEVQENDFTRRFGGDRVTVSDVVDLDESNPRATIIADLRHAPAMASDRYDCIILTQTLHVIDDVSAVLVECRRLLKPGGVLLATVPAASRVCLEYGAEADFWRMTPAGARRLFETVFGAGGIETLPYGNVQTNVAFLEGFAVEELEESEFDSVDPYFPALTGIRAQKMRAPRHERCPTVRGVVLLYHRVEAGGDVHALGVSPDHFNDQLTWLRSNCTVMPLEEMLGAAPEELPDRAVALTFDDGYIDNLSSAAPAMEQAGVAGTFFLTTRWLDETGEYWWDALERVLLDSTELPEVLDLEIAGEVLRLPVASREERRAAHDTIHPRLVRASLADRDRSVAALIEWSGDSLRAHTVRRRPMLADELRALAQIPGMDVGAHTINHLALTSQQDEVVKAEIERSRESLERVIGRRVRAFAYPYGAVDRRVAEWVRPYWGFGCSCVADAVGRSFDSALVPRVEIKDWDVDGFAAHVNEAFATAERGGR